MYRIPVVYSCLYDIPMYMHCIICVGKFYVDISYVTIFHVLHRRKKFNVESNSFVFRTKKFGNKKIMRDIVAGGLRHVKGKDMEEKGVKIIRD